MVQAGGVPGNLLLVYLGSRQRIMHAVNDKMGIEPDAAPG
jgi:hypothetical protein